MFKEEFTVRFYETDALQHVSNTVLVGWFEAARLPIFKLFVPDLNLSNWPLILASYNVDFLQQIFLQSPVQIVTHIEKIGNSSFKVYQECWQDEELKAKGTTTLVHFDYASKKSCAIPNDIRVVLEGHLLAM
jgi:acyl-CoA thioester hydrolase